MKRITRLEGRCIKAGLIKGSDDEEENGSGEFAIIGGALVPVSSRLLSSRDADAKESTITVLESSLVFIDRFNGASSGFDDEDDVLGLPINELTSRAKGLPFTV